MHNLWRLYGGWYDGNPAHLKPAPDAQLAGELAALAGGAARLAERATELAAQGDLRLAGHLAELATQAAPDDPALHRVRADVFGQRGPDRAQPHGARRLQLGRGGVVRQGRRRARLTRSPRPRPAPRAGAVPTGSRAKAGAAG